jgi:hypothetical protein
LKWTQSDITALEIAPSGQDSLLVREAYFHELRSRHFGDWGPIATWVVLVIMFITVGFIGLSH